MRVVRWFITTVVVAGICWLFPLFHLVPLNTVKAEEAAAKFDATQFVETFWTNKLQPGIEKAIAAKSLLIEIQSDPATAKRKFSRSVGLSESYFYFLSGEGRVVAVSDDGISLAVTDKSTNAEVLLQAGLIFGDAIRDGTGLLDPSTYPNSQDFNDISAALNQIVETRVLPDLKREAKAGVTISFAGCAEVDDESTDLKPLKVVPIQVKVQ
jgi:predicted lipoprotein